MNTETLEEQAMNKIYNREAPNELKNQKEVEENDDKYEIVSKILENHRRESILENLNYRSSFAYLKIDDDSWQWHLIKLFDDKYGMILSSDYIIEYDASENNSELEGIFVFRKEKEYLLEYRRESLEDFQNQMVELRQVSVLIDTFKTDRHQLFYEYEDFIYLYQDHYVWKLSGYTKNDITEYYQMYLLLISLEPLIQKGYQNNSVLKYLYLIDKNAITYLYRGIDLKKKTVASLIEEFQKIQDVVTISLDNNKYTELLDLDYLLFKRRKGEKREELPITIQHKDAWTFDGTFKLGLLGTYLKGELLDYNSIFNSKELSDLEKKEMLQKVVIERKEEALEKKDYLNTQFLISIFYKRLENIEIYFEEEKWINFLKAERLPIQDLSVKEIKRFIIDLGKRIKEIPDKEVEESSEWEEFLSYIDFSSLKKNVSPLYLSITPIFMVVEYNLFGSKKNYIVTEDYQIIEWK